MKTPAALMFVAGIGLVMWALFSPNSGGQTWISILTSTARNKGATPNPSPPPAMA